MKDHRQRKPGWALSGLILLLLAPAPTTPARTAAAQPESSSTPTPNAPMQTTADFPYESHYVEVLGSRMHYVETGEGAPVLFIHGQPTSSYLWRNVLPYVAPRARAIAVDLIGMGKSGKPDIAYRYPDHLRYLEAFIEALDLENVTLVLHDWGSTLGFDYAMRHEDNVRGLAFMEALIPPAFPFPGYEALPEPAREMFKGFRDPVKGRELLIDRNMFIEQMLPNMILRELTEEEMNAYREPFLDPASREPIYRWPNELPIGGEPAHTDRLMKATGAWLTETPLPKLHLYASPGAANPPEVAAWTAEHLPNIETVFVGAGIHFIQEDRPEAIGRALADWIRRLPR
jgi:haloalkane dehalogenase